MYFLQCCIEIFNVVMLLDTTFDEVYLNARSQVYQKHKVEIVLFVCLFACLLVCYCSLVHCSLIV